MDPPTFVRAGWRRACRRKSANQAGLRGYEYTAWTGIVAPAATPKPIVRRLYSAISAILSTAEAREWFAVGGRIAGGEAPDVFAALIRAEHAKWGPIVRAAGIKPAE